MTSFMVILSYFCAVTNMTTASRQLWLFARDQGVPFHHVFSKVSRYISFSSWQSEKSPRSTWIWTFLWTPSLPQPSSLSYWYRSASVHQSHLTSWRHSGPSHFYRRIRFQSVPWHGSGFAKGRYEGPISRSADGDYWSTSLRWCFWFSRSSWYFSLLCEVQMPSQWIGAL